MARFVIATSGMVALLALALVAGGVFAWLALLYITVVTYVLDRIAALAAPDHPEREFPAGERLSVALGLAHFPLLHAGAAVVAGAGDHGAATRGVLFFALALFLGQVSNSNAHELIHRSDRWLRRLGMAVYASMLFGHHVSAHLRVHHVHAATARDPNSAPLGRSFWAFAPRAWIGSFRAGLRAETALRRRGRARGMHPYLVYALGSAASLALAGALAGWAGLAALLGLALYAQAQLLLSDYVQHYGLRRRLRADGRPEPVGPQHSWNAPRGFSSALMLNAPRHSDHHAHPGRPYPGLDIDRAAMPILPQSLPVMAVLALVPPAWHRLMDRRAARWQAR
ncbi:alkane 1-monooxygenase [Salipiger mucosus]|uniref:Alkane-1 monooxygenase n=1 Tax=Salipiger mucosus DSM 16094 TaxID=1123237 RepID=S9RXA9_9RHOB|nr:alkane 1-monooxygenase [Salipiger mucosus]EPX78604.1 Alkane-1 monooxygenase [Salipiger mucosus DSM 16094]